MTSKTRSKFIIHSEEYIKRLMNSFNDDIYIAIENLAQNLLKVWLEGRQVFICGNGGSAANALHMANDLLYGTGACGQEPVLPGIKVEALSANTGVLTCLANDTGYENIFSHQLEVKASEGELLIILSGSGNSLNVMKALQTGRKMKLKTYTITAYTGGLSKDLSDVPIHFPIDDMQIAEDTQLITGHICMQWLSQNKPKSLDREDL